VTAAVINIWKITYKLRRESQHKIITGKVRGKKTCVNTVKLLLLRNSPIMVPMNTCVIHPNFSLDEVQLDKMAFCYQYIDFTYKKEDFTEKARYPHPLKKKMFL